MFSYVLHYVCVFLRVTLNLSFSKFGYKFFETIPSSPDITNVKMITSSSFPYWFQPQCELLLYYYISLLYISILLRLCLRGTPISTIVDSIRIILRWKLELKNKVKKKQIEISFPLDGFEFSFFSLPHHVLQMKSNPVLTAWTGFLCFSSTLNRSRFQKTAILKQPTAISFTLTPAYIETKLTNFLNVYQQPNYIRINSIELVREYKSSIFK